MNSDTAFSNAGRSGYERPNVLVGSPALQTRRSWKPKYVENEEVLTPPPPGSRKTIDPQNAPNSAPCTTSKIGRLQGLNSLKPPLHDNKARKFDMLPGELPLTDDSDMKPAMKRATVGSEGLVNNLRQKFSIPRRSSMPLGAGGDTLPLISPGTRWSRAKIELSELPPAFRTSQKNLQSPKTMGNSLAEKLSTIEKQRRERLVPKKKKSELSPVRMKASWPPVQMKLMSSPRPSDVNVPLHLVQDRRSGYESPKQGKQTVDLLIKKLSGHGLHDEDQRSYLSETIDSCNGSPGSIGTRSYVSHQTSLKVRFRGPAPLSPEGHPLLYDDIITLRNKEGKMLPPIPYLEGRFDASNTDVLPMRPAGRRSLDDWSDDESIDEDVGDKDLALKHDGPDVWLVPSESDRAKGKRWRVKRVWNAVNLDAREKEFEVDDKDLMDKIKALSGVPVDGSGYNPSRLLWNAKWVFDLDGEIQQCGKTQSWSEGVLLEGFEWVHDMCQDGQYRQGWNEGLAHAPSGATSLIKSESSDRTRQKVVDSECENSPTSPTADGSLNTTLNASWVYDDTAEENLSDWKEGSKSSDKVSNDVTIPPSKNSSQYTMKTTESEIGNATDYSPPSINQGDGGSSEIVAETIEEQRKPAAEHVSKEKSVFNDETIPTLKKSPQNSLETMESEIRNATDHSLQNSKQEEGGNIKISKDTIEEHGKPAAEDVSTEKFSEKKKKKKEKKEKKKAKRHGSIADLLSPPKNIRFEGY